MRRRRVLGLAEMMNFPGVIAGSTDELEKLGLDGRRHVDGHAPGAARPRAAGVRGRRDPLRPRGAHRRGGPRAAARRHVAARPRGLDGAQPAGAAAAASRSTGRGASRSARTTAIRRTSPTTATSTRWCARRSRPGSRPRTRVVMASHHPALWHGLRATARSRQATSPTCSLLPDLVSFQPSNGAEARAADRGRRARRGPGVGAAVGSHRARSRRRSSRSRGRRQRARDRPRRRTRSSPSRSSGTPSSSGGRAVADAERDLAKIAVVERHLATGPHRARLRRAAPACSAARSPRASRTTRTTSSSSA